eukprot:gene11048-12881_t
MNDNICINFPNLTDLTLIGSYINDEVLINAVQHSPKLQNLKLAEAQTLTAASYAAIDDVVIPLLVEWLDFIDVARFDKACAASRRVRANLGQTFSLKQAVFHNNKKRLPNCSSLDMKGFLRWLLERNIKLAEFVFIPQMYAHMPLVESYLKLCGSFTTTLSIAIYNSQMISTAMKYCPHVKILTIDFGSAEVNTDLYSETVETLYMKSGYAISKNIKIKFPNMRNLTVEGSGASELIFMGVLQNTNDLQSLKLDGATALKDRAFDCIGPLCPSLQHLSVCEMSFPASYMTSVLSTTTQLKELLLRDNHGELSARKVFNAVATNCPHLTALTIAECDRFVSAPLLQAFHEMLTHCVHLRSLRVPFCNFVTDDLLRSIASHARYIECLDLSDGRISNTGLAEVAKNCTELKYVKFTTGSGISATSAGKLLFQKGTSVDVSYNGIEDTYGTDGYGLYNDDYSGNDVRENGVYDDMGHDMEDYYAC